MRSRAKQGQDRDTCSRSGWSGRFVQHKRRAAADDAMIESREQIPLSNWQTHQWERACNAVPRVQKVLANGTRVLVRKLVDRYPFSKLERRADAHS